MAMIVSIQAGLPRELPALKGDEDGRPWTSAILKEPVAGPIRLGLTSLEGDGQADLVNHGGPDRALLLYSADHYALWRDELGMPDLPYGAFGENLAVSGLNEGTVCLGDLYTIGDVVLQVSQPRQPCAKLDRRVGRPGLAGVVKATGRTGWYCRVLRAGVLQAGSELVVSKGAYPQWTITRAHQVMIERASDRQAAQALGSCEALSSDWRGKLLGS